MSGGGDAFQRDLQRRREQADAELVRRGLTAVNLRLVGDKLRIDEIAKTCGLRCINGRVGDPGDFQRMRELWL